VRRKPVLPDTHRGGDRAVRREVLALPQPRVEILLQVAAPLLGEKRDVLMTGLRKRRADDDLRRDLPDEHLVPIEAQLR